MVSMVSRGDICWAETPEDGRRPMLVLTRNEAIPVLQRITVAAVTRTIRGLSTEVLLDQDDGMPDECVVSLDNVRHVHKSQLSGPIARLSDHRMREVCCALAFAVNCK